MFIIKQIAVWMVILAIATLWNGRLKGKWIPLFAFSLLCGYVADNITLIGMSLLGIYVYLVFCYYSLKEQRIALGCGIIIFCLLLMGHKVIGFNEAIIHANLKFDSSVFFNLGLNYDKAVAGFIILAISGVSLLTSFREYRQCLKPVAIAYGILIILLIPLGFFTGFVKFSPSLHLEILPLWLVRNLFLVVIVEEAFFRLFMFDFIGLVLKKTGYPKMNISILQRIGIDNSTAIKILVSSIIFALYHLPMSGSFAFLCFFAGIGYGVVYSKTGRIEAPITLHFLLGLTHFLLFTYPMAEM